MHPKIAQLSDAAFRLTVTAWAWCVELRTDGHLPKGMVPALTRAPQGRQLQRIICELVAAELWHDRGDRFEVHDFLDYNMSSDQYEARARAGASGGRTSGESRRTKSKALASSDSKQVLRVCSTKTQPESESESESESEISVSQIREPERSASMADAPDTQNSQIRVISGVRDPCRMSFVEVSPKAKALFEVWRSESGKFGAKLDGKGKELFERLVDEGVTVEDVTLVVRGAKLDLWARDTAKLAPSAILGSAEQRLKFAELAKEPPKPKQGRCPPQPNSGYRAKEL